LIKVSPEVRAERAAQAHEGEAIHLMDDDTEDRR
jgi:hypothetical protein